MSDEWEVLVDPPLLFRFSALTYNGHRIHDDRDHARDVEGHPGLATHRPLQTVAMAEAVRERVGRTATSIDYRLVAPLYDHQGLKVGARPSTDGAGWTAWARDLSGRVTARATITTD